MRLLRSLPNTWIAWCSAAVIWFVLCLAILAYAMPSADDTTVIYTPALIAEHAEWLLFFIPLTGLVIGAGLYYAKAEHIARSLLLVVVPVFSVVCVWALLGPVVSAFARFSHVDTVRHGDHVYHLASYPRSSSSSFPDLDYVLYECDRFGVSCTALYRHTDSPRSVFLVVNDGMIVLREDYGDAVYTFRPG